VKETGLIEVSPNGDAPARGSERGYGSHFNVRGSADRADQPYRVRFLDSDSARDRLSGRRYYGRVFGDEDPAVIIGGYGGTDGAPPRSISTLP
jgi:hypothetical protein